MEKKANRRLWQGQDGIWAAALIMQSETKRRKQNKIKKELKYLLTGHKVHAHTLKLSRVTFAELAKCNKFAKAAG